jgi:hypothetical protein
VVKIQRTIEDVGRTFTERGYGKSALRAITGSPGVRVSVP